VSVFYLDTSALLKRYIVETGTQWTRRLLSPVSGNTLLISELATTVTFSTFARLLREKKITALRHTRLRSAISLHMKTHYSVVILESNIIEVSKDLVTRHPLRALDALHLASALIVQSVLTQPITFITADLRLLAAAQGEGFAVDDPNAHPV
jgi:uncharacterized protein